MASIPGSSSSPADSSTVRCRPANASSALSTRSRTWVRATAGTVMVARLGHPEPGAAHRRRHPPPRGSASLGGFSIAWAYVVWHWLPSASHPRPARWVRAVVLIRVHAAQDRGGGAAAVAGNQAARAAAADLRFGDLRGGWLHQGPDDQGDRADRSRDHTDPGRAPYRGEPLGRRTAAADRLVRGGRGAEHAGPAGRPARRPER